MEFDASRRAKVQLVQLGILERDEMEGVDETLNAAALTYVAAFCGGAELVALYSLHSEFEPRLVPIRYFPLVNRLLDRSRFFHA